MERARAKKVTKRPRTTELSRLKRDLQRVSKQLKSRDRELAQAQEQQTATSDILGIIASSPTDLQSVLISIAENAARLCVAVDAVIDRVDGHVFRHVANYGQIPGMFLKTVWSVELAPAGISNGELSKRQPLQIISALTNILSLV